MNSVSIVVPVYNESVRLKKTLPILSTYSQQDFVKEIIFVDDGSTDATRKILTEIAAKNKKISVISYQKNKGKGYAVRKGCLAAKGSIVGYIDVDLSAPLEYIDTAVARLSYADIVIGSRKKGITAQYPRSQYYRKYISICSSAIRKLFVLSNIEDTQCGFKFFKKKAIETIAQRAKENGYVFDIELLVLAKKHNYQIYEIPISWTHNSEGKHLNNFSTIAKTSIRMFIGIVRITTRLFFYDTKK